MSAPLNLSNTSVEIGHSFLLNLPITDISQLCQINKWYSQICQDDNFWRRLVKRDFGVSKLVNTDSYKCLYQLLNSPIFVVTTQYKDEDEDEDEDENDDNQPYTSVFTTLNEAIDNLLGRISIQEVLHIKDFEPERITDIDPDFVRQMQQEDIINLIFDDPTLLRQFNRLRTAIHNQIRKAATETVDITHGFSLETPFPTSIHTIQMRKFQLQPEPKYDFMEILNETGTSVHSFTLSQYLGRLRNSIIAIRIEDGAIVYEDWYRRRVKMMDPDVHQRFIQMVKTEFNLK